MFNATVDKTVKNFIVNICFLTYLKYLFAIFAESLTRILIYATRRTNF